MGSNPISPTIITIDTSPLQALHRVGLLPTFQMAFDRVLVPRGVYDETQASLALAPDGMVPDLTVFGWLSVCDVDDSEIAAEGAVPIETKRACQRYRWCGRKIDRPELEAVLLAKRERTVLLVEDAQAVRCAADVHVPTVNVADVLSDLERRGHVQQQAGELATRILETGYYSKELRWLSWSHQFHARVK